MELLSAKLDFVNKHELLVLDFINTTPFLSQLSSQQQRGLVKCSRRQKCPGNTIVIEAVDNQDIYIIMKGSVKAILFSEDGKKVILGRLGPGDYFGTLSIFHELPQSIAIITLEDSDFLIIPGKIMMNELKINPEITMHLLFNMSKKLRDAIELIHDLAFLGAKQRVVKALLDYYCERQDKMDSSIIEFQRPPMKDIAAYAGISRETASRVLRELSEKKLLSMNKKNITISKELKTEQTYL